MPGSSHAGALRSGVGAYQRVGPGEWSRESVDASPGRWHAGCMPENNANDDLKAKMREALERKQANDSGVPKDGPVKEKAHGSEVTGGAGPKMHRRKAGGGGS